MSPNYLKMNSGEMLEYLGSDARRWADAFCQIKNDKNHNLDESYMIGWFANAIMKTMDTERHTMDFYRKKLSNCERVEKACDKHGLQIRVLNALNKFDTNPNTPIFYEFESEEDYNCFKLLVPQMDLTGIKITVGN